MNTNTASKNETEDQTSETEDTIKKFEGRDPEAIITELGGSDRGRVNRAIYKLTELNLSKGQTAKLIGKRFQHVRNVLHNQALQKAKRAATPAAPQNLDPKNSGQASAQVVVVEPKVEPKEKIETTTTKSGITLAKTGFKDKTK